jgi:adenine phosphoribosyltransferase
VLNAVAEVPDFPKPGVKFKDITPVLVAPVSLDAAVRSVEHLLVGDDIEAIAGIEARGFILGAPLAVAMNRGFVPVRKAGKLPPPVLQASYSLEYGTAQLEVQPTSVRDGQRFAVVDDVLATGGTADAACRLVEEAGGEVVAVVVLIELAGLGGRDKLAGRTVRSLATL